MSDDIASSNSPDAAGYRAGRETCRLAAPDVFFASHMLPRSQRHAADCLVAVWRQLEQIVTHEPAEAESGCAAEGCGGETPEQRRAVASAVLDHLYRGEPTGRPELDGFPQVARRYGIERALVERAADGMAELSRLRRVATWKRLRELCSATGGAAALLAARVLTDGANEAWTPARAAQAEALGAAVQATAILTRVGADWRAGRLLLPLDDLVKCGVTERDIVAFAEAGTAGADERWRALLAHEAGRVRLLYEGGAGCLAAVPPAGRRAAAVMAELWRGRLAALERGRTEPFAAAATPTRLRDRMARLPAAIALAARGR